MENPSARSRREFIKGTSLGIGAVLAYPAWAANGGSDQRLLVGVRSACRRLASLGWRKMLLDATGGELDLMASDLAKELQKPLTMINRSMDGFGDFNLMGTRAIEPGRPDSSLLYHAFASPTVVADGSGTALRGFPTIAEIDALENYIYGVRPPTMEDLRKMAGGNRLGMVVYAPHYRNVPMSVHGKHAELCFSRTGISRLGNRKPIYDARARNFVAVDEASPFDFHVIPRRFVAYLAVQLPGASPNYGPQDPLADDDQRKFWVPIHKLFSGRECIAGMNLRVNLSCGLRNDELASLCRTLNLFGMKNVWSGDHLEEFPFTIKDEKIGSISKRPEFGPGVLEPKANPITEPAHYKGRKLTIPVDGRLTSKTVNIQASSLQLLPPYTATEAGYMDDAGQGMQRPAPEYLNIRHRVLPNGEIENLNLRPDLQETLRKGGYDALLYTDGAGDGWVKASCPQLEGVVDDNMAGYCTVGLPDFFPKITQRELLRWLRNEVPEAIRGALFPIHPLALSQTRIAGNVNHPAPFSLYDTTITAIVTQSSPSRGPVQKANGPWRIEKVGLPDGSPGLFDPGWDTSQSIYYLDDRDPTKTYADKDRPTMKFLSGHGLGSPFIEDAKLCAALGNYWPGVSPDSGRQYQPDKRINEIEYPYPTNAPLTDEEIGIAPLANGTYMPWDGVRGPKAGVLDGKTVATYSDFKRVDYIDLLGTMTAALTSKIDTSEYKARIMAMAAVYWALGIRDPDFQGADRVKKIIRAKANWAVLSFQSIADNDSGFAEARSRVAGAGLPAGRRYSFHLYRWGKEMRDPKDMRLVHVEMLEQANAYVVGTTVILRRGNGPWSIDTSMPT
jgi:hypothetical protein